MEAEVKPDATEAELLQVLVRIYDQIKHLNNKDKKIVLATASILIGNKPK